MTKQLLFYENAVPVSASRHADLRVETGASYTFASHVSAVAWLEGLLLNSGRRLSNPNASLRITGMRVSTNRLPATKRSHCGPAQEH